MLFVAYRICLESIKPNRDLCISRPNQGPKSGTRRSPGRPPAKNKEQTAHPSLQQQTTVSWRIRRKTSRKVDVEYTNLPPPTLLLNAKKPTPSLLPHYTVLLSFRARQLHTKLLQIPFFSWKSSFQKMNLVGNPNLPTSTTGKIPYKHFFYYINNTFFCPF